MRRIVKFKSREEWLVARKQGIGGSEAAAICQKHRWSTRLSVYMDKVADLDDIEETQPMYWGSTLERVIANEWSKRNGKKIRRLSLTMMKSHTHDFLFATPDAMVVGEDAGLEIKTSNAFDSSWGDDELDDQYIIQCQHYMMVTGKSRWYLAALVGGNQYHQYVIERNDKLIGALVDMEVKFWNDNILAKFPPLATSQDSDILNKNRSFDGDELVLNDFESIELVEKFNETRRACTEITELKSELSNRIKQKMNGYDRLVCGDYTANWDKANRLRIKKMEVC